MARIRRSLHTMLLMISNSKPEYRLFITNMFELFSCWRSPCCWRTTCSYIHLEVRRVLTKIKEYQQSKKDSTSKRGIYKVMWQRSTWKNSNNNCMHDKDRRCISMLERRLTIKDEEVKKWQMTKNHHHDKEQKMKKWTFIKDHKAWRNKVLYYSSTTHKVQDKEHWRPNHVEHHSNDHPLGGNC